MPRAAADGPRGIGVVGPEARTSDFNLASSRELGLELAQRTDLSAARVYPAFGRAPWAAARPAALDCAVR